MGSLKAHLRNKLIAGLLAAIPVAVTIFIVWYVDSKARELLHVRYPFVGIAIALGAIYVLGVFVTSVVGRFVLHVFDGVIRRVPGLRDLYRSWKQVALADTQVGIFAHVVLVPDESGHMRVLGFSSGKPIEGDPNTCCVFVPASPNPTSGRLFFVPIDRCLPLDMSPQSALKLLVSGGNFVPAAIGAATFAARPIS